MEPTTALRRSARDPAAFTAVYDEHAQAMLVFFARRTFDAEVAADLTAETFALAFRQRRRFRGRTDEEAGGWLYAIARRQLGRFRERGAVERRALRRLGVERAPLADGEQERVEELAGLEDLRARVGAAVDELSPAVGEALRLRVVDELPYCEVARRLAITEQAARARVSRALRGLTNQLSTEEIPS
jgi:RNA polymerase sigma-70 factor (ECF subfamily)